MSTFNIEEIKSSDVLKKGDFWAGLIMGTMFGFLAIGILWSIFRLISGNDPAWDFMNDETGNFIVFLAFLIAGFKSYNSVYNRERLRRIEEQKEWEQEG
jgi:hypothetical protein|tara:strand:- start:126 stop:422 length:297 start_codon:yes stop_codon:yes gene_type:complete